MKRVTSILVAAMAALMVSGCAPTRPDLAMWQASWDELVASIPAIGEVEPSVDERLCDEVLATIRQARNDLVPTPDPTLDAPVDGWLGIAEEAFFECPPRSGEVHGFEQAYAEMQRFEAEIAASIESS